MEARESFFHAMINTRSITENHRLIHVDAVRREGGTDVCELSDYLS